MKPQISTRITAIFWKDRIGYMVVRSFRWPDRGESSTANFVKFDDIVWC
jgi:hypothetical protein